MRILKRNTLKIQQVRLRTSVNFWSPKTEYILTRNKPNKTKTKNYIKVVTKCTVVETAARASRKVASRPTQSPSACRVGSASSGDDGRRPGPLRPCVSGNDDAGVACRRTRRESSPSSEESPSGPYPPGAAPRNPPDMPYGPPAPAAVTPVGRLARWAA